ncbi:abortive phage infection protein [Luteipulveratus mongoliensis]|uniref:Abortive phage infection protein n=1 Tax=Luteipulveratus mongoliensis TaxID=571913 RepID=A0A0K1JKF8_9MICO|nr:abortive phage infection protein [Luteipulveratus mongoliensis]AKU17191.1 abortive phage infection protein [Luteipulveratus mongoliensis]
MHTAQLTRAQFLRGAAAAGVLGPLALPARASAATPKGLKYRGVVYQATDGEFPETTWNAHRMRTDLWAIKTQLHANSVLIEGDGVDRLAATATEAAERGLHVWLRPTLGDRPAAEILDHLAETGRHAEELRRHGAAVHLSVGCEFVLYVPGIVPGKDALERIKNLQSGNFDPVQMARRLHAFTSRAAATGRSVFRGKLTYSAAQDEDVDWRLFDIVGIDYYSFFPHRSDYIRELRQFQRWGKPVAILEFGACTYHGAPQDGGMGWSLVDYDKTPPEIIGDLKRDERQQADYLTDVLAAFESMGLYAAMAYNFVTPDAPHRRTPRYDLDLTSYGLVKPVWNSFDRPGHWHWEPKLAFHALARQYRRAGLPLNPG